MKVVVRFYMNNGQNILNHPEEVTSIRALRDMIFPLWYEKARIKLDDDCALDLGCVSHFIIDEGTE